MPRCKSKLEAPMQRENKVIGLVNIADTLLQSSPSRLKWQPKLSVYVHHEHHDTPNEQH